MCTKATGPAKDTVEFCCFIGTCSYEQWLQATKQATKIAWCGVMKIA